MKPCNTCAKRDTCTRDTGVIFGVCNVDYEPITGNIRTTCPDCGAVNHVEVTFSSWNRGFDPKEYVCPTCGARLTVTDPHQYNEDSTIAD